MKRLILLSVCLSGMLAHAGDKIGNGGGTWTCRASQLAPPTQILLVDFFEAREQHGWKLRQAPPATSGMQFADQLLVEFERDFPSYGSLWRNAFNRVKASLQYVNAELEVVDDALYQIRPLATECAGGQWFYTQFANFNAQGQVLVSRVLWESPLLSEAEKAGLIWHEAIYLWLRESHGDVNSVRARMITGLLFSTMGAPDKITKLAGYLNAPVVDRQDWFCTIQNTLSSAVFGAYGATEFEARIGVTSVCQANQYAFHCNEHQVRCEQIQEQQIKWSCAANNVLTGLFFMGRGRNRTEAEFRSQEACQAQTKKHDWLQCVGAPPDCHAL